LVAAALGANIFGQVAVKSAAPRAASRRRKRSFSASELKEGMKGSAWTVFRGSEPEEFQVEILGVVPGAVGPKQDMIVGRISGGSADRTSVFARNERFARLYRRQTRRRDCLTASLSRKSRFAASRRLNRMLAIFEKNQNLQTKPREARPISFAELSATSWKQSFRKERPFRVKFSPAAVSNSALNVVAGQSFQPIATPISFSGISQETLIFCSAVGVGRLNAGRGGRRFGKDYFLEKSRR
jgi:hypothetical protein